jgi:DNA segregation ATPase FtsK/SpoIIIE-like protein
VYNWSEILLIQLVRNMDDQVIRAENIVRVCFSDISISLIQRHLRVGYSVGVKLMNQLILKGVVIDHGKNFEIRRYTLKRDSRHDSLISSTQ